MDNFENRISDKLKISEIKLIVLDFAFEKRINYKWEHIQGDSSIANLTTVYNFNSIDKVYVVLYAILHISS